MTVAPKLPPLLTDPPWLRPVRPGKPVVIADLVCTDPAAVAWLPGEREAWLDTSFTRYGDGTRSWQEIAHAIAAGTAYWYEAAEFFTGAPEELARPLLAGWRVTETWEAGSWMRVVLARFELDALPTALDLARRASPETAGLLLPFSTPEIAVLMADWLARLKSLRRTVSAWLRRHPAEAARALVPPALGKAGSARRQAERALLALPADAVRAAGVSYRPEAAAAIETLLAVDPLTVLPAKMPPTPAWAVPATLPPVRLRDGSGALPAAAAGHLVTMLSISGLEEAYPGLEIVRQVAEPADLAEFAWAVFQRWQSAGADAREDWALAALGLLGDDETVRRLTPLILAWPGKGGHAKAVAGVEILATIGSDAALLHLYGIAQRARFTGLKSAANQKISEVAAVLGLSAEQLGDRLVPDFGMSADGSLRLDYGPRQFTVGLDEQLRPFVTDGSGTRLKTLPKPGARDDAQLAPAAYELFTELKRVAADQVRRLERAMVTGRRWSGAEFHRFLAGHPLLQHVVRRLVWGVYDASGVLRSTVDTDFPDTAIVGVAHPLHLADTLAHWIELFAARQILQPFPQLSRPIYTLTPEEAAGDRLTRFENLTVPTTALVGLERLGWRREAPQDGGMQNRMELRLAAGLTITVELEPGIAVGDLDNFPEQKLTEIYLHDGRGRVPVSRLDPVAASELLRDLTTLTA